MKNKKLLILSLLVIALFVTAVFSHRHYQNFKEVQRNKFIIEKRKADWLALEDAVAGEVENFKGEAGILIKDLGTGWEIYFNKERLFPSASMTKIPIMAACFLAAEEGKIRLERNVSLKASDKMAGSGMLKAMPAGTVFSVQRLIGLMIYDSDNTATNILTNLLGINYLNDAFRSFGLKDTTLSRRIADYRSRNRGIENYTNAQDMGLLLEKLYRRESVSSDASERCLNILKLQRVNDRIPKRLPVDIIVAHKTGLERGVCHDAGIVFTCRGDFLIVVLTQHTNPNSVLSKEFIARVSLMAYNYFDQL